jgi:hypothetical protein
MSTNQPPAILTDTHLNQINSALQTIEYAKKEATKAQLAGIDVTQQMNQIQATEAQLRQLKSVYFPGQ